MVFGGFCRILVLLLGYAYPGYNCYKDIESNNNTQWKKWLIYWLMLATMTMFESVADTFIFWVPMYSEAKVAFVIYLWHPRTEGAVYMYQSFLLPFLRQHEHEVDRFIDESKTRCTDLVASYWTRAMQYAQQGFMHALQNMPQPQANNARQPTEQSAHAHAQ